MRNFPRQFREPVRLGRITLAFRNWAYPKVQVGKVYEAAQIGSVLIEDVKRINLRDVREADALAAGWHSLSDFRQNYEQYHPGCDFEHEKAYRIRFRYLDGTKSPDTDSQ